MCEGLIEGNNDNLTKFNLSKNLITDQGAHSLVELFKQSNTKLAELYLGWNKITGPGACSIAEIMGLDTHLRVIDLCWNGLGQGHLKPGTVGQHLGEAIKRNNSIIHFDLSFNKISAEDTKAIGSGLKTNNSMYGFHFRGNSGKVDSLGYLHVVEDDGRPQILVDQHLERPIKGVSPILIGRQLSPIRPQPRYIFND